MKQVKLRSMLVLALIAVLGAGVALFCVQYVVRGGQWAAFSANDHAYRDGRLALGQVLDRNGLVLYDGASGTWAEDGSIRRATLHAVGDRDDNISTSAKAALRQRLVGFDPLTGTSAGGHKVYLTIDAELNAAALEALNAGEAALYRVNTALGSKVGKALDRETRGKIKDAERALERVLRHKKADKLTPADVTAINAAREALSTVAAPLVAQWESEK